jgi:hypothetical protein
MSDTDDSVEKRLQEAIKLIGDWAKWIITVELAITVSIGALLVSNKASTKVVTWWAKAFGTLAIGCFLVSIAAAAILLLTLPEIMQKFDPKENVWYTQDSFLQIDTEKLALTESFFFGIGIISVSAMIVSLIWS